MLTRGLAMIAELENSETTTIWKELNGSLARRLEVKSAGFFHCIRLFSTALLDRLVVAQLA